MNYMSLSDNLVCDAYIELFVLLLYQTARARRNSEKSFTLQNIAKFKVIETNRRDDNYSILHG